MPQSETVTTNWQPINTAPFGEVILVKNDLMDNPIKATRGYVSNGMVNKDQTLFTSVATKIGKYDFFPSGKLVCPTHWSKL